MTKKSQQAQIEEVVGAAVYAIEVERADIGSAMEHVHPHRFAAGRSGVETIFQFCMRHNKTDTIRERFNRIRSELEPNVARCCDKGINAGLAKLEIL